VPFDPSIDPAIAFVGLFRSPSMFDSRRDWTAAGFTVFDRHDETRIMVARHATAPGLLFKKYSGAATVNQCKNYDARVEGADRLRALIAKHDLKHVAVPRKWVIDLPLDHGKCEHVLVVEHLDLIGVNQIGKQYRVIDDERLRELCFVLFHFRGLDSIIDNIAFTTEGKLAFIDTEHWYGGKRRPYLRYIRRHLSRENRLRAKQMFRRLERGVREIDASPFSDEEDTSSWSSLSS
jgi:hypothetical protein